MEDRTEYCLADWAVILELSPANSKRKATEDDSRGGVARAWRSSGKVTSDYDMQEAKKILETEYHRRRSI
ncbi:MAG: hypothetical protein R3F19_23645 [Verrucomicrobiales bacterium]